MTDSSLIDRSIAALRANHDQLAPLAGRLTEGQLALHGGAAEWTLADVLSHLGSGAEIFRYALLSAIGEDADTPENTKVWDRWNSLPPLEQASGFVASDEALVAAYEALTPEQRSTTVVDLGFLPQPVPPVVPVAMRLNEQSLHGWDVRVGLDAAAQLGEENAALLLEHYADTMSFMVAFMGKPEGLETASVAIGDHTLVLDEDGVRLTDAVADPSARFEGPLESAVRLLNGRLKAPYLPDGVAVTGNVTLEQLQQVFQGY